MREKEADVFEKKNVVEEEGFVLPFWEKKRRDFSCWELHGSGGSRRGGGGIEREIEHKKNK